MNVRKAVLGFAAALVSLPLLAQNAGQLVVKTNTGRAGVFVDGKYLGPAANFRIARTYSVSPGEHELKLADPRFEEVLKKITIEPGKKLKVSEQLKPIAPAKPPFGRIRTIHSDKFGAVYVNDRFFGHVDEFSNSSQGILINPGDYEVKIVPGQGAPVVQKIKVEADKVSIVR